MAKNFYDYLILGGGNAGVTAAQTIRSIDETKEILIVSEERDLPYRRPMLTKNFSGIDAVNPYAIHDASWYEKLRIQLMRAKVLSLDVSKKCVSLDSKQIGYGKLIYALGSHSFIPPFDGVNLDNVVSIRSTDDVRKLCEKLKTARSAAVIGGGVLGLEAAWEMRKLGKAVTVIEASETLMKRNLDSKAAEKILNQAKGQGVEILLSGKTKKILSDSVLLEDGRSVQADVVVLSCGVRANSEIASGAGINVERAVVVDEKMHTSADDVFACGDCCSYNGFSAGIWPVSQAMGKVAGANAAGQDAFYAPKAYALMMNALGTSLYSAGTIAENAETEEICEEKRWTKLWFEDDKLTGFIMIGDTKKAFGLTDLLEKHVSRSQAMEAVKVS